MTNYELVKDKLYNLLNYYLSKARECKGPIEFLPLMRYFTIGACKVINKADLSSSDKDKLLIWLKEEMTVFRMLYACKSKNK